MSRTKPRCTSARASTTAVRLLRVVGILSAALPWAASTGCGIFGGGKPVEQTREDTVYLPPDTAAALAAPTFRDDAALERLLGDEPAPGRTVGSRRREFALARTGTAAVLTSGAVSPDGLQLAVGLTDGGVRITPLYGSADAWDSPPESRVIDETRPGVFPAVTALAWCKSAEAVRLVSATRNGRLQLWACSPDGRPVPSTPERPNPVTVRLGDNAISALAAHPAGTLLAVGGAEGTVRLVAADDGRVVAGLPPDSHRNRIGAVGFSPDGRHLLTADDDGTVALWRTDTVIKGKAVRPAPPEPVDTTTAPPLAPSPAPGPGTPPVPLGPAGPPPGPLAAPPPAPLASPPAPLPPAGSGLSAPPPPTGPGPSAPVGPRPTPTGPGTAPPPPPAPGTSVTPTTPGLPTGPGSPAGTAPLAPEVRPVTPPPPPKPPANPDAGVLLTMGRPGADGRTPGVLCVAFSPQRADGRLIAAGTTDARILLWRLAKDPGTGPLPSPELVTADQQAPGKHTGSVRSVTFSPDALFLASGSSDGSPRLWLVEGTGHDVRRVIDVKTGNVLREASRLPRPGWLAPVEEFRAGAGGPSAAAVGFAGEVHSTAFIGDGLEVVATGERAAAVIRARRLQGNNLAVGGPGAARRLDWTRPTPPADYDVVVEVVPAPAGVATTGPAATGAAVRQDFIVRLRVNNTSQQPDADLFQMVAVTDCRYPPTGDPNLNQSKPVPGLHGRRIHLGRVPAKGSTIAEIRLTPAEPLPEGDYVLSFLWAHAHQPTPLRGRQTLVLPVGTRRSPLLSVAYHTQEEAGGESDGILQFGERCQVALLVKNTGSATARDVRLSLDTPSEAEDPDFAPFRLELAKAVADVKLGDLRPGESRRKVIGPLTIKAQGADGAALPEGSLPLQVSLRSDAGTAATVRMLRIPVAPPLAESASSTAPADAFRTRGRGGRQSDVLQFRSGPGAETAVLAECQAGDVGPLPAEGMRGGWLRVRLPAETSRKLQEMQMFQTFVWVRRGDVQPAESERAPVDGDLRPVPFGDDTPVIDHNLPDGPIRAARHLLAGVVSDADGVGVVQLVVDGQTRELYRHKPVDGPALRRVPLPRTPIDLGDSLRREVTIIAEDASPLKRRQVIRLVLEKQL